MGKNIVKRHITENDVIKAGFKKMHGVDAYEFFLSKEIILIYDRGTINYFIYQKYKDEYDLSSETVSSLIHKIKELEDEIDRGLDICKRNADAAFHWQKQYNDLMDKIGEKITPITPSYIHKKTYLIKNKRNGLYKIGKSTNPRVRERTLQSEEPTIEMVKVWNEDIESALHKKYAKQRVRGEWFKLTPTQVRYITKHY